MKITFYVCALTAILTTLRVITHANPIHSLIYFIISLFSISGIFFSIGAYFAGALEVIIYAGAIIVLFIFVIMMLNLGKSLDKKEREWINNPILIILSIFISLPFVIMLVYAISQINNDHLINLLIINAKEIGIQLFSKYILLVELSSILLLAGLIVSLHIGRKDDK